MRFAREERMKLMNAARWLESRRQLSDHDVALANELVFGQHFQYPPSRSDHPHERIYREFWELVDDARQRNALQSLPLTINAERAMDRLEQSHRINLAEVLPNEWPSLKYLMEPTCVSAVCCVVMDTFGRFHRAAKNSAA